MVSGCNIQISLCCNTASLRVWITDCNRGPVLHGWKSLQVLPSTEGRFRILIHNLWVIVSAAFCFMESLSLCTMGTKHFIKSDRAWVFFIVPSKDIAGRRHREGWIMVLFLFWFVAFQRPPQRKGCAVVARTDPPSKWWRLQICHIPFWHPFKINEWNIRFWEWIATGMLMFSQRFGKLVH